MAGKATALTEAGIERIGKAPKGQRREKFDRLAPGLCLRVNDKGRKAWVMHFRLEGKLKKMSLGAWPGVPVDDARRQAEHIRELAQSGIDPREAREREKRAAHEAAEQDDGERTFRALAEQYIERECPKLKNGKDIESYIRRHLIPAWGDQPITELRKRDAIRLFDPLVDAGKEPTALKLHEIIRRIFNWAADRDEIDVSPFANLKPPAKKQPRQRVLKHGEIRVLWQAWGQQGFPFGPMDKLLLLTGQRLREVADMQWAELDNPDDPTIWTIPSERSKNGQPHRVPLSGPARDIIRNLPRFTQGDYVFSTTDGRRPVSGFSKAKTRTDKLASALNDGEPLAEWVIHDLRRTVRTELARIGVSEKIAEKVLNHSGDPLVRVYDVYDYEQEKTDALERWARELMVIVGEHKPASNVVPLPEAG